MIEVSTWTGTLVAAIAMIACKGNPEPARVPANSAPSKPTPTATMSAPVERNEWVVAKATSTSGKQFAVTYRLAVPAGINPPDYGSCVTVRCPYADRGDGTGFPTSEQLNLRQDFEEGLESSSAILLMSWTGGGAREMVFQVKSSDEFLAAVPVAARKVGLICSSNVEVDRDWSGWRAVAGKGAAHAPSIGRRASAGSD
jgi:hypothetical protein